MAQINTTHGLIDEAQLMKLVSEFDNDNEHTATVEYCLLNCSGNAHRTGVPDSVSHFCDRHVHRSVHVTLKKPISAAGVAASFG